MTNVGTTAAMTDVYEYDESDYVCPFCRANCGPDYSDYSDHIYDEHAEQAGPRVGASGSPVS